MTPPWGLAVALVTAHLLGDFVLQPGWMNKRKSSLHVLLFHATIVAALSYVLAGVWFAWEIPVTILITHTLIDFVKVRSRRHDLLAFTLDQAAHILVIAVLVWRLDFAPVAFFWVTRLGHQVTSLLVLTAAVIATTKVAGIVIEKAIHRFQDQLPKRAGDQGFLAGGETIGHLERFLILIFVLIQEPGAIGFLLAAKSILRFGELREHRKEAEYVIIGTMWSLVCGLVVAILARATLALV